MFRNVLDKISQQMFFNEPLRTLMEGYIELTLAATLNIIQVRLALVNEIDAMGVLW